MARSRRQSIALFVLLGGVLLLAVGGTLGVIAGEDAPVRTRGETTTSSTAPTTTLPSAAALGDVGAELDALIEAGRKVDHHALYSVTDPELPEGLVQTVEVWRRGELFRSDIVERTGGGTRRQTSISGGSVARACETVNGVETCNTVTSVPTDLPAAFVRTLNEEDDVELRARDDDVAGYVARCFEAEDVGELCLAEDGVMLRLVLQGATVEATRIEDEVPAAAFDNAG
jgi:hypothetical protein